MLRSLRVRNLALAENVAVDFDPGLNILTGETGAGKSILIGALALILGERADKSLIRTGEEQCTAEAVFELADGRELARLLEELGLPPCEDGALLLRRSVKAAGGQNWVNDAPATVQALRRIGEQLVDMHGPHDHQSLFQSEAQRDILDAFARTNRELEAYREAYGIGQAIRARRAELESVGDDVAGQMDLLAHRVKEIEEAALKPGEEEAVREEHEVVGHARRILELGGQISAVLTEEEGSAFQSLASTQRSFDELSRLLPVAKDWKQEALDLASRTQELGQAIQTEISRLEADPARLEWLDQRLAIYQRLLRKYGPTLDDVHRVLDQSSTRLQDLKTRGEQLADLEKKLAEANVEIEKRGRILSARRKAAASELAEAIAGELEFLGFPGSSFAIVLEPQEPDAGGMDRVDFGFAPNVGESMRPLKAIASSGEISRVMLAIKAVLSEQDRIPVLVFDEIDANLGGSMGHAVGRELAGVAERRQVICITHLPQVAVHGTTHFAVVKEVIEGRTLSRVTPLQSLEDRATEIARMLGGSDSPATLVHARELIDRAGKRPARRSSGRA
ncbi:MAG: DNA repair protein RecN [Kiritimatiellia bacterium]|nr:DNA repair protein RecN [Kiritimatiellia bacterium]